MKLLYSTIFNIVLLAVCSFDGLLFASPKSLESAYKACGLNGLECAAMLRGRLKTIAPNHTQDTIRHLIRLSLPCINCSSCNQNIETEGQDFFDALSKNGKKRVKRLRYFVVSSVLQSCKQHACAKSSSSQAGNKQRVRLEIQEDYQDYLEEEWEDEREFFAAKKDKAQRNRAYKQRRKERRLLKQLEAQDRAFEQDQAHFDELMQEIDDQLADHYAQSLSWSDDQYDAYESDDEQEDQYDSQEDDQQEDDEQEDFYAIAKSRGNAKWSKPKK
jgi:hypothetical protein